MSAIETRRGGRRHFGAAVFVLGVASLALFLFTLSPPATAQTEPAADANGQLEFTIRKYGDNQWYTAVQLADMDEDGYREILIGNRDESTIEVWHHIEGLKNWYNDGVIPFDYHVHDFKVADFDNDGDMDIVAGLRGMGLYYAENISYYPGTFQNWDVQPINGDYTWQVLVEDFDKDGHLDVFQGVDDGPINLYYGDGRGNFVQGASVSDPATDMRFPVGFNAIDLNGDNRPDLIGVDGSFLRAFLNPGNRTSAWTSVGPATPFGSYPCCDPTAVVANLTPSAADLDGNGVVDQVAFLGTPDSNGPLQVLFFKGSKSGGTLKWDKVVVDTIPNPGWGSHAGVADLDGDGNLDIHVGGWSKFNGLRVYLGDGKGGFTPQVIELDHGVGEFNTVVVADLNRDGGMEIVTNRYTGDNSESSGFEILFGSPKQPSDWQFECVDCPPQFRSLTEHSLRYDAQGRPHIAFGGNFLYHAWHDGQKWQTEIVDDRVGFGFEGASLVLDADGRARISYWAGGYQETLRYAVQTADGWQIDEVEYLSDQQREGHTSLAIDSQGRPYIGYSVYDPVDPTSYLKVATKAGSTWTLETVATSKSTYPTGQLSLALDGNNRPHLSFSLDGKLRYAYRDAGGWKISSVKSENAGQTSIAIGPDNQPRISYDQAGKVKYAYLSGSTWQVETVRDGEAPSLTIDSNGNAHLAFNEGYRVNYAVRQSGSWQVDPNVDIDREAEFPQVSLALTASGEPGLVYLDGLPGYAGRLVYRQLISGTSWLKDNVVESGRFVGGPDIALDAHSRPAISYSDYANDDLKYAHQTNNGWTIETVEQVGDVHWPQVDLDKAGNAHIVYSVGRGASQLKYARQTAGGWQLETVKTGLIGLFRFALGPDGRPHIVFSTVSGGTNNQTQTLTYTYRTATGWQSEVIHSAGYPAVIIDDFSLAVDSQGRPHVALLHRTLSFDEKDEVRYMTRGTNGWTTQQVELNSKGSYLSTSLDLDRQDAPHLVYSWSDGGAWIDIIYAHRAGSSWVTEPASRYPLPPESGGTEPAMALGPDDQPHITYYDVTIGEVWYGVRTATGWQLEVLEDYGWHAPAIAVDQRGAPHLAYIGGGLRHAMKSGVAGQMPIYLPYIASPSIGQFAFVSNRDGNYEIYLSQ